MDTEFEGNGAVEVAHDSMAQSLLGRQHKHPAAAHSSELRVVVTCLTPQRKGCCKQRVFLCCFDLHHSTVCSPCSTLVSVVEM